jgi:hypothetical protein
MTIKLRFFPGDWWLGFEVRTNDLALLPTVVGMAALRQRILFIAPLPTLQLQLTTEPRLTLLVKPAIQAGLIVAGGCGCQPPAPPAGTCSPAPIPPTESGPTLPGGLG